MKQHLGNILEKAVRSSGYPISKLAKRIGYTRQHIYNLFLQKHLDFSLLEKVGKIINHNFTDEIKQLKKYEFGKTEFDINVNEVSNHNDSGGFKEKYYKLLEEHTTLLKENSKLLKSLNKK